MTLTLKVPSIACSGCVETVTKAIVAVDPKAIVKGDAESKTITVETQVSQAEIEASIVKAGHTVA